MENQPTHTPTPWGVVCDSYGKVRHSKMAAIHGPDYNHVAQRIRLWGDAHFIVHAVNAHEELLGLVIHLKEFLEGYAEEPDLETVKNAIAKAQDRP